MNQLLLIKRGVDIVQQGLVEYSWTMFFQLFSTVLWIGIIYLIYFLVFKLPRRIKRTEEKIEKIESMIEKIDNKLDS